MLKLLVFLSYFTGGLAAPQGQKSEPTTKCSDFYDGGWRCVKKYQCSVNRTVNRDGSEIIDIRTLGSPLEGYCDTISEVCCLLEDNSMNGKVETEKQTNTERFIPDFVTATFPPPTPSSVLPSCGKRYEDGLVPSQGEEEKVSKLGEWPHVCLIHKKEDVAAPDGSTFPVSVYVAGASLLAPGVVLTGAVRIAGIDLNDLAVRCGEWDTVDENKDFPYQERVVVGVTIHPKFNPKNAFNNIAVLFLDQDFDTSFPHISPICLPRPYQTLEPGTICYATGWGKNRFGAAGKYSTRLKEVAIPIVSREECQQLLGGTRLGQFFQLDESFVCAGGDKNLDTCKGDGGSPLVCQTRDQDWAQVGIVAWGIGCNTEAIPGVYTNVAAFSCWIDDVVSTRLGVQKSYFGLDLSDCFDDRG